MHTPFLMLIVMVLYLFLFGAYVGMYWGCCQELERKDFMIRLCAQRSPRRSSTSSPRRSATRPSSCLAFAPGLCIFFAVRLVHWLLDNVSVCTSRRAGADRA